MVRGPLHVTTAYKNGKGVIRNFEAYIGSPHMKMDEAIRDDMDETVEKIRISFIGIHGF